MLQVDCDKDVKVAKLTSEDDIETYLTTFERLVKAHNVKKERWTYKLTRTLFIPSLAFLSSLFIPL